MIGLPPTVAVTELVWSAVALVGLAVNLWALRDAYGDLRALLASGRNGARKIVADGQIRREWIRCFKQGIFLGIGAYLMATPPANPHRPVTRAGLVLTAGLIAAVASMVVGSLLDRRERVMLIEYIDRTMLRRGAIPDDDD